MMGVLEIDRLYKDFKDVKVIEGLDLSVPENSVFGFVGQNGAGKTTTMKMILGFIRPDSGSIAVCGERVAFGETKTNRFVGYLPDVPEFYGYMRPREYLRLCGDIAGLPAEKTRAKSEELLSLVGLADAKRRIGGFSRGMKQRLGIAQALLHEPKLLLCDEPTSALDPIGRKEILDILSQVKGKTTVVFSTHILSDIERVCDHMAVLHHGKLALNGTLSEIKARHRHNSFDIEFASVREAQYFADAGELKSPELELARDASLVRVKVKDGEKSGQFLIDLLAAKGLTPNRFAVAEPTLENLFVEAVQ